MLGSVYQFRLKNAQNDFIENRKRYEKRERELADLSGKKTMEVEVSPSETRFTGQQKQRKASSTGLTIVKNNERRLVGADHH